MNVNDEKSMYEAVRSGDLATVKRLVATNRKLLDWDPNTMGSLLHHAARAGHNHLIDLLLAMGLDINSKRMPTEVTPLSYAISGRHIHTVQHLLKLGADPNIGRILIDAMDEEEQDVSFQLVKLLIENGANVNQLFELYDTKEYFTALDWASDNEPFASYLKAHGAKTAAELLPDPSTIAFKSTAEPTNLTEEIIAYFTEHFGPVDSKALIEIVPTAWPPITIHVIPPSKERNHITLFTTGMSSEPMKVPEEEGSDEYRFAEIFIQVPGDWKYKEIGDPNWGWPQYWLRSTAQYPHVNETWLGGPVTIIANDDPPQPLAPNTKFTSLLLLAEHSFASKEGKVIQLYRMAPLYTEERDLEIREGIGALLRAFDKHSVPFMVDLNRRNVATS